MIVTHPAPALFRIHYSLPVEGEMRRQTADLRARSSAEARALLGAQPGFAGVIVHKIKRVRT